MPQTYPDILSSDQLVNSRQKILDRDEALRSAFAGSTQPSSPVVGQFWLDTDESPMRLYQCVQESPSIIFREIPFGTLGALATANPAAIAVDLIAATQGAWRVPTGPDANRPGTVQEGMIRGSTTQSAFEGYIGGSWKPIGAGFANAILDEFEGNGSQTAFTLTSAPGSKSNCRIIVDGSSVLDDDFSLSGTTLTLASAPPAPGTVGRKNINVVYSVPLSIGTPADGSVTSQKIAAGVEISGVVLNDGYTEEVFTITDGASVDLNPSNGSIQLWTLGANRSPTASNFASGRSITLHVNDGTARTITWPSVSWFGGTAPTLATSGYTVIELWKVGTTLYGSLAGSVA